MTAKDGAARPAALREHEESARFFSAKVVRLEQHLAAMREAQAEEVTALMQQLRTTERGKEAAKTEAKAVANAATAEVDFFGARSACLQRQVEGLEELLAKTQ